MDADVRSNVPGKCPRCGMTLVEGIMDVTEYPETLTMEPKVAKPGEDTRITFLNIVDPEKFQPVRNFGIVHEKLFHLFVVSQDLKFFLHTHPERAGDEDFHLNVRFPRPGMYRILSDFYPVGATPQLITNTVMVPGTGLQSHACETHAGSRSPAGGELARRTDAHAGASRGRRKSFDVLPGHARRRNSSRIWALWDTCSRRASI